MTNVECDVISRNAVINGKTFPMYSGFLSAIKIDEMAEVPNFSTTKPHHRIAATITHPPIDEWQRPLDSEKADSIKAMYSDPDKCNLMANPVLIGYASTDRGNSRVVLSQKKLLLRDGSEQAFDGFFNLTVKHESDSKPLWILDGQHRVEGMLRSTQRDEPMPFVLLYGDMYTPPILAEIFTQVTTKATPMENLHAEWMNFAFGLDKYESESFKNAMKTTTHLCMEAHLSGSGNPFMDKIRFNPYQSSNGYFAFIFDCREWTDIISKNYYQYSGTTAPRGLAEEIVRAVRILDDLDTHRRNKSKLFSSDNPHKILAEGFLVGLLRYVAENGGKTDDEWKAFYEDPCRQFDKSDWSLPFVKTSGALSSGNGPVSKEIAKNCFITAFSNPDEMEGTKMSDYLYGLNSKFRITAYTKTTAGKPSRKNAYEEVIHCHTVLAPFDINTGGVNRDIIKVQSATPNCHVFDVFDDDFKPPRSLPAAKSKGLDVSGYENGKEIFVSTMSYSGDTKKVTTIRLDK